MGKGDRRTRRGKIWRGTTGKRRPRVKEAERVVPVTVAPPPKPEKRKRK